MAHAPTVSVAVISYNAAGTIEETLDSVLAQDLGVADVELVISDDASADDTVRIAGRWLARNGQAFRATRLLENETNGGVSRNCNQAWRAATGTWIKTIAADDVLQPRCLSANLQFASAHPDADVIFSRMRWFGSIDRVTPETSQLGFFELPALDQYKALRFGRFNIAPTSFIRRRALQSVGYADESLRNIEDLPLWIRLTQHGYRLHFNDCVTVNYRVAESISKSSSRFINVPFLRDLIELHRRNRPLPSDGLVYRYRRFERSVGLYSLLLISKVSGNRRSVFTRALEVVLLLLRPVDLYSAFRRRADRVVNRASARRG